MAVNITPQQAIAPADADWYAEAEANRVRANQNDTNLKNAVEALQNAVPVQKIKQGTTTYSPDANGLVTLPSGVVAPATTTTERDAITNPTVGQLIYNTTNAQLEVYTPNGWAAPGSVTRQVFTASGTWTKPVGAKLFRVIAFGGGGGGAVGGGGSGGTQGDYSFGGGGGARDEQWLAPADVPASVSVTVGAGGAGATTSQTRAGSGGPSSFGTLVQAGGGQGGAAAQNTNPLSLSGGSGVPRTTTAGVVVAFLPGNSTGNFGETAQAVAASHGGWGGTSQVARGTYSYIGPSSVEGAGAGGSCDSDGSSSSWLARASGQSNATRYNSGAIAGLNTTTALASGYVGTPGAAVPSGRAGNGGQAIAYPAGSLGGVTGGAGSAPGGGGGALASGSGSGIGGAGARGEVIVDVFY